MNNLGSISNGASFELRRIIDSTSGANTRDAQPEQPDTERLDFLIERSRYSNYSVRLSWTWPDGTEVTAKWVCSGHYVDENNNRVEFYEEAKTAREAIDLARGVQGSEVPTQKAPTDSSRKQEVSGAALPAECVDAIMKIASVGEHLDKIGKPFTASRLKEASRTLASHIRLLITDAAARVEPTKEEK